MQISTQNAYDEVPYASFPFPQTNPSTNRAIAYLFGLNTPDPASARILELGCASGNNILSIAARFPNAQCVGIDLSAAQIEEGNARITELGITNLSLEQKSILDIDATFGQFDYIICHGVFSWVPRAVQEGILRICKQNLSPDGIAYVSYNTLPGWNHIAAIREMMLYHTAAFTDPTQKAQQARLLLKFMRESIKPQGKSFYADILETEDTILTGQSDWYLLHDHMEEHNIPYYFHQFMDMARSNDLQYLAETSLSGMFSQNLPEETAKALANNGDIVRTEQYLDFIYNRRFRSTLLCHNNRVLRRNLDAKDIQDQFFTSQFILPDMIKEYVLGSGAALTFTTQNNRSLTTDNPVMIAALIVLSQQKNKPLAMAVLCIKAIECLKQHNINAPLDESEIANLLATQFLRCIFLDGIVLHLDAGDCSVEVSEKPKAFSLAAYQAAKQEWLTTLHQATLTITPFDRALLPLLNGENDVEALTAALLPYFETGALSIHLDDQKIIDTKTIQEKLPEAIRSILERYALCGLLVS